MSVFEGKHILLGVTGSIAAYKAADIASKLTQAGADLLSAFPVAHGAVEIFRNVSEYLSDLGLLQLAQIRGQLLQILLLIHCALLRSFRRR